MFPGVKRIDNPTALADVFFVHPTTYIRGEDWNQSLTSRNVNFNTNWRSIRNQASVFNDCCRVYAPRYRQAILYAFITDQSDGPQALDLAYQDVLLAFRYFIKHHNKGRPFVLAGHSQGAYHLVRLLEEEISGKPIRRRFVVAYAIGIPIPLDKIQRTLPDIPSCRHAQQTSCLISWNTYGMNASTKRLRTIRMRYPEGLIENGSKPIVCVNPLTWNANGNQANATTNQGGVVFGSDPSSVPKPDAQLVSAQCRQGVLRISHPAFYRYRKLTHAGDYHNFDYQLFYMNIRRNAASRVKSFLAKGKKTETSEQR